jgi:hypothetical protein
LIQHFGLGCFGFREAIPIPVAALFLCLLLLPAFHCEFPKKIHRLSECIIAAYASSAAASASASAASASAASASASARLLRFWTVVIDLFARAFSCSLMLFNSLEQCFLKRARLDDGTRSYFPLSTTTAAFRLPSAAASATTAAPQQ